MIADELGYPIALKISSPDLSHKSDVGGVVLDLKSASEARAAYAQVSRTVSSNAPSARLDGVLIQKQAPAGQEVIIGVSRDPTFGPLVMFGMGGTETEALKDVAFALAPLSASEASDLLEQTWAGRRLRGFRNLPSADRSAVEASLVRLSWLAVDYPDLAEIEINPLIALPQGVIAVDVRARRGASPTPA